MKLYEVRDGLTELCEGGWGDQEITDSFNIFDYDKYNYMPWRSITAEEMRNITRAFDARSTLGQIKARILARAIHGESSLNLDFIDEIDEWQLNELHDLGYKLEINENGVEVCW